MMEEVVNGDGPAIRQLVPDLACLRRVPTTPDPNTSEKVSRYKWEAYRDTNWWCIGATLCQEEGIFLQKYRHRNGSCIAILFKSIGVRGCFDSPECLDAQITAISSLSQL